MIQILVSYFSKCYIIISDADNVLSNDIIQYHFLYYFNVLKRYTFFRTFQLLSVIRVIFSNASCNFDFGINNDNSPSMVHISWNWKNTSFSSPNSTTVSTAPIAAPPNNEILAICRSENCPDIPGSLQPFLSHRNFPHQLDPFSLPGNLQHFPARAVPER